MSEVRRQLTLSNTPHSGSLLPHGRAALQPLFGPGLIPPETQDCGVSVGLQAWPL